MTTWQHGRAQSAWRAEEWRARCSRNFFLQVSSQIRLEPMLPITPTNGCRPAPEGLPDRGVECGQQAEQAERADESTLSSRRRV